MRGVLGGKIEPQGCLAGGVGGPGGHVVTGAACIYFLGGRWVPSRACALAGKADGIFPPSARGSYMEKLWGNRPPKVGRRDLGFETPSGCCSLCCPLPAIVSLQLPKVSGNRTWLPATCQGPIQKGLLKWEFCAKTKCALKETDVVSYFCEMISVILYVYFAHFSKIQGKVFLGMECHKGSHVV